MVDEAIRITAPDYQERIFNVGKNGTGKSTLTFELEAAGNYRQAIYFDIKGDCQPHPPFTIVRKGDDRWGWRNKRIVYRPGAGTYWRTDAGWSQVLERLQVAAQRTYDQKRRRAREPRLIIIPEILLFGSRAQRIIGDIASGSRAFELGLWVESQRPRRIPVVARSEAWRLYVFPLGYEDDEIEVLKYAKGKLTLAQLRELDELPGHPFYEIILRSKAGGAISVRRCPELDLAA